MSHRLLNELIEQFVVRFVQTLCHSRASKYSCMFQVSQHLVYMRLIFFASDDCVAYWQFRDGIPILNIMLTHSETIDYSKQIWMN